MNERDIGDVVALPVLSILCRWLKPMEIAASSIYAAVKTAANNEVGSAVVCEIIRRNSDMSTALIGYEVSFPMRCFVPRDDGFACGTGDDVELTITVYIGDCQSVNAFDGIVE